MYKSLTVLACLVTLYFVDQAVSMEVVLKEDTVVTVDVVLLGDVARLGGEREFKKELGLLRIGKAPHPGGVRLLSRKRLAAFIRKKGWKGVIVKGPDKIKVRRSFGTITKKELEEKIYNAFVGRSPWPAGKAVIKISVSDPSFASLRLPRGRITVFPDLPGKYAFIGKESATAKILVDGKERKKVWFTSDVKIYADMVTAQRPILRNEILRDKDLLVERRLISSIRRGGLDSISEIVGMRAKRKIDKGAVISGADIALPPLFKRGSLVTIIAEKGGLYISTNGKALESGYRGKVIRVQNIGSKRVVLAEVVDLKTVKVGL